MAHMEHTFFEVKNSNLTFSPMHNLAGTFVTGETADICPSGLLCVKKALLSCKGYANIPNGNTWTFTAAADGKGDGVTFPEIFAFNSYDAQRVTGTGGTSYYLGAETAGLELPAGELGTFTRIVPGEIYRFGLGNFKTAPAALPANRFVTITNGQLTASATAFAAGDGLVFEILGTAAEHYTTGTWDGGQCYRLLARYAAPAAAQATV